MSLRLRTQAAYERLLEVSIERPAHVSGSEWAKITKPEARETNVYFGRILLWTDIDKRSPWLNTSNNKEATDTEKKDIEIPEHLKPNFKPFYYAFDLNRHVLMFEIINEMGQSFGPRNARRFFSNLFYQATGELHVSGVEVTVVPEDDSVETILNMSTLNRLKIVLVRPNGDDLVDDIQRVIDKLRKEKARRQTTELVKAAGENSLEPDDDTKTLARVAALNGHVEGDGRDEGGNKQFESTQRHPKRITYVVGPDQSSEIQFLSRLEDFSTVVQPSG